MLVLDKWATPEIFLTTFNPDTQSEVCITPMFAYTANTPTLRNIADAYNRNVAEVWVSIQLHDLSEFSGCKDKLSEQQLDALAKLIVQEYATFKVSEMMLFFWQFKCGKFGKFYGVIDSLIITEALCDFRQQRNAIKAKILKEKRDELRKKRDEEYAKKAITYEEYRKGSH